MIDAFPNIYFNETIIAMLENYQLLYALTLANLKSRYRNTFYGFLWVILNPILILGVQAFAFSVFFKIEHRNYVTFLMSGLLPWLFIVQSIEMCTGMFVSHSQFIKNIPVSPIILLLTQVVDNFINFLIPYFVIFLGLAALNKVSFSVFLFMWLPITSLALLIGSMCLALASVNVVLRDLKFVTGFVFSLLFYLTPIFYPSRFVPVEYRYILDFNIFYYVLSPFQILVSDGGGELFYASLIKSFIVSIVVFIFSILIWKKFKKFLVVYA
jgi:ABC-type polysaccharide/polyol phosphate export permease